MASSQKAKIEEIIDATEHPETSDDLSASEPEDDRDHDGSGPEVTEGNQPSTSQKKKKKKKSRAAKALNALRGKKEIPQELVDVVVDKVKAEHGDDAPEADEANVRMALEHMKIMDVMQGKAGIGGKGKKDMGEHKVRIMRVSIEYFSNIRDAVLGNTTCSTSR
jgi:glycylpeptide N-tetradecanoyltransferase